MLSRTLHRREAVRDDDHRLALEKRLQPRSMIVRSLLASSEFVASSKKR